MTDAARSALVDAGLALAERLQRRGFTRLSIRTLGLMARATGGRFSVKVDGATIGGSLIHHAGYLRLLQHGLNGSHLFQLELFKQALAPGMTVLDCGAHLGLYTVLAAHRVGPNGKVIALEPDPLNVEALRANVTSNGVADRVEVVEAAASDRAATIRLHLDRRLDLSMRVTSSIDPVGAFPSSLIRHRSPRLDAFHASIDVPCLTVDEVLAGRHIDVGKIDVEGAEPLVLRGMREALAGSPGPTLFIECHPAPLERAGTPVDGWLATLRDTGSLEVIDETRQQLRMASREEITGLADELGGWPFNVRWTVGGSDTPKPKGSETVDLLP